MGILPSQTRACRSGSQVQLLVSIEAEEERQKQAFENQAHNYGLEADDFRRTVSDGTRRYRLDEFEHAPGKHSIIAKNLAGWHISTKQVQKTDGEYNFVGGGNVPGEHPYHK
tara:strand:+ start:634 stop:969 length:336 start_codon:yes stop_codon:yes gene_type:complete